MKLVSAMVCGILLLLGTFVYAETALPTHKCIAPPNQRTFATQAELDRHKSAVEQYRSCLEVFVKEQEAIIETHRQAALRAIGEWEKFVGQNTNAPPKSSDRTKGDEEFRSKP
jgi:hypothetical protein